MKEKFVLTVVESLQCDEVLKTSILEAFAEVLDDEDVRIKKAIEKYLVDRDYSALKHAISGTKPTQSAGFEKMPEISDKSKHSTLWNRMQELAWEK